MRTFYAFVWITVLGFIILAIMLLTSCAGGGYYSQGPLYDSPSYVGYDPPQPSFIPASVYVQPSVIPPAGSIDTAFHPAPLIPTP
jgi:hypothetical protein